MGDLTATAGIPGWAKALAVTWVLAFAVLLIVGVHHHLIGFNQNY